MGTEVESTRRDRADVLLVASPRWTDDGAARFGPAYQGPAGRSPHHLVTRTHSALRRSPNSADTVRMSRRGRSALMGGGRVVVGTLEWRDGPGGGVHGRRIGRAGGWTAFVGPTLASPCGWIVDVMSPCDWPTCARMSWPMRVADVGLEFSLIVFRIVLRDRLFTLWAAYIGRLRLEAEPRAPEGRLLPHISGGWDRIAATQQRRLVCPLGAGVLACVGPLWTR